MKFIKFAKATLYIFILKKFSVYIGRQFETSKEKLNVENILKVLEKYWAN